MHTREPTALDSFSLVFLRIRVWMWSNLEGIRGEYTRCHRLNCTPIANFCYFLFIVWIMRITLIIQLLFFQIIKYFLFPYVSFFFFLSLFLSPPIFFRATVRGFIETRSNFLLPRISPLWKSFRGFLFSALPSFIFLVRCSLPEANLSFEFS